MNKSWKNHNVQWNINGYWVLINGQNSQSNNHSLMKHTGWRVWEVRTWIFPFLSSSGWPDLFLFTMSSAFPWSAVTTYIPPTCSMASRIIYTSKNIKIRNALNAMTWKASHPIQQTQSSKQAIPRHYICWQFWSKNRFNMKRYN